MVRIRVAYGVGHLRNGSEASPSTVRYKYLTVGEMNELGHGATLEHVVYFPSLGNTLGRESDTGALGRCGNLRREVCRLNLIVDLGATAHENLRDEVRRRKWEKNRRTVNGVRDTDTVRDVWKNCLSVCLDVIDDRLVVGDDEDSSVGESESTRDNTLSAD